MSINANTVLALRNAPTLEAYRAAYLRASRFPKIAALGFGPILRLMQHHFGHDATLGHAWPTVELPKGRSKVIGSLVVHPRLLAVEPGFGDDTVDGVTFFYSAHNCTWSSGTEFSPYQITHIASGGTIVQNFTTRADAEAAAKKLMADPAVDWPAIDADHNSEAGKEALRAVLVNLKQQGLR